MLTFIPSWKGASYDGLSNDDLIGQIQAYHDSGESYQVIVRDDLPDLRYFLHRYDLLECNYQSVYDTLQESQTYVQHPVALEDLKFPQAASFHFLPRGGIVRLKGEKVGQVYFGAGSHLSEVHYFKAGERDVIDYYDDRGFISRRQAFHAGAPSALFYLDIAGEWIFRVEQDGVCIVNPENKKGLKHLHYFGIEELEFECVDQLLLEAEDSALLVSIDPQTVSWVEQHPRKSKMTLSLFKDRYPYSEVNLAHLKALSHQVRGMIVDEENTFEQLAQTMTGAAELTLLSPYDTRFTLSKSQEYPKEVLYIDVRQTGFEKIQDMLQVLVLYCEQRFMHEERELQLLLRVSHAAQKKRVEQWLQTFLLSTYPALLEEIDVWKKMSAQGEKGSDDFPKLELSQGAQWLKLFQEDLEVLSVPNDDAFFKLMHPVRLVIDLGDVPDLFTQIASLSLGVPQINGRQSRYVKHRKNGWIIESVEDLEEGLVYYLDRLKHWQESRVFCVEQIKRHSGVQLQMKLSEIVGE